MLNGTLFTIAPAETETATSNTYRIELNINHEIFSAHFPDEPILPGACQVEIARSIAECVTGKKMSIRRIRSAKFISVIDPRSTPSFFAGITISEEESEKTKRATISFYKENTVFSKSIIEFN